MLKQILLVLLLSFTLLGCTLDQADEIKDEKRSISQKVIDPESKFLDVVISEIAWAGTDNSFNDEWIELFNNTLIDIDLNEWAIKGDVDILLSGLIPSQKHFLLERTDELTIPDLTSDQIYSGSLNNTGGILYLMYKDQTIDQIAMSPWAAGSNSPKISMERILLDATADDSNWQDGSGDIEGAENSNL